MTNILRAGGALALLSLAACGGGSAPCVTGATLPCDCQVGDACFTGAQVCQDGTFGACQCTMPTGDAGAGMCAADSGTVPDAGTGPDAGSCSDGATETRASAGCGEETRTCTAGTWSEWVETTPGPAAPECLQGEAQFANRDGCDGQEVRWRRCGSDCHWETAVSECGGGCAGTRRTTPEDQEEICVPAGPFVVGCDALPPGDAPFFEEDCTPRHEVYLSAFYIDRHVVSIGRYEACVDAGACTQLEPYNYRDPNRDVYHFDDTALLDQLDAEVWTAIHEQVEVFCEWDGAALVTGAQWERAATGIYERARWPFTDDLSLDSTSDWCRASGAPGTPECGGFSIGATVPNRDLPITFLRIESSIGLTNLYHYFEWTSDTLSAYAATPAAGPTPRNPHIAGHGPFELRGFPLDVHNSWFQFYPGFPARELWHRNATHFEGVAEGWGDPNHAAFRCARPAEGTRETR